MIYKRNCPNCGNEIQYKNPRSFKWADRDDKPCRKCYSAKISKTLKDKVKSGEWAPHIRNAEVESNQPKNFKRSCPDCGNDILYTSLKGLKKGERAKTICNSCSTYKYNKTFKDIITEDHRKQMRATKAGFASWEDYKKDYPKKEMYKREVWRYTYQNDLEKLPNWEKRGRNGVEGAYQLDHIISINEGWEKNIPPNEIGKWENLRMIPWEQNRKKW